MSTKGKLLQKSTDIRNTRIEEKAEAEAEKARLEYEARQRVTKHIVAAIRELPHHKLGTLTAFAFGMIFETTANFDQFLADMMPRIDASFEELDEAAEQAAPPELEPSDDVPN